MRLKTPSRVYSDRRRLLEPADNLREAFAGVRRGAKSGDPEEWDRARVHAKSVDDRFIEALSTLVWRDRFGRRMFRMWQTSAMWAGWYRMDEMLAVEEHAYPLLLDLVTGNCPRSARWKLDRMMRAAHFESDHNNRTLNKATLDYAAQYNTEIKQRKKAGEASRPSAAEIAIGLHTALEAAELRETTEVAAAVPLPPGDKWSPLVSQAELGRRIARDGVTIRLSQALAGGGGSWIHAELHYEPWVNEVSARLQDEDGIALSELQQIAAEWRRRRSMYKLTPEAADVVVTDAVLASPQSAGRRHFRGRSIR